jgi:YhcH/YjgK/YiaL family protein
MILDTLSHAEMYTSLHPLFEEGFRFIREQGASVAVGQYELAGGAYAMVQEYQTRSVEGALFESHRRFIDIQYLANGSETIYFANLDQLKAGTYQPEKDYLPLEGSGSALRLQAGDFAVFFPQDGHLPSRDTPGGPGAVRKIVVKIPVQAG